MGVVEMDDLKLIKKHYGEKMAHLCRELFPTILETPGVLYGILSSKFAHSKFLYDDIVANTCNNSEKPTSYVDAFKNIIYGEYNAPKEKEEQSKIETPQELLETAGYTLYECKTAEDIKQFEKYYSKGEKLCTFMNPKARLDSCHVFFAVKKYVDEIRREDFKHPERQDEYGTSVISIQFTKGDMNIVSIKNRYNHTVANPDATFSNNLDNIIEGLTKSFEKHYKLNTITGRLAHDDIPGYVYAGDGKYYKYNFEYYNVYYCPNNIIISYYRTCCSGENIIHCDRNLDILFCQNIVMYDTSRYIVFDRFILDMKEKKLHKYESKHDALIDSIGDIESIKVTNNKDTKEKTIIINDTIEIVLNEKSQIVKYSDPSATRIDDGFLDQSMAVREIDLPNVEYIGECFLNQAKPIERINLPKVKTICSNFLGNTRCPNLRKIDLPSVQTIRHNFICANLTIEEVNLPQLEEVRINFLEHNKNLKSISLPKLKTVRGSFLRRNQIIERVYLPQLAEIGPYFLEQNIGLETIALPSAITIGDDFLYDNQILKEIKLPKVVEICSQFLAKNKGIREIHLPSVQSIGSSFIENNEELTTIDIPNCTQIGISFLCMNTKLRKIRAKKLNCFHDQYALMHNREALETLINIAKSNEQERPKEYIYQ